MKNICIREEYTNRNGETKVSWNRIGVLIESNGKQYVKLYHIPNTLCSVFEPREKDNKPQQSQQEYIDVDNEQQEEIPF